MMFGMMGLGIIVLITVFGTVYYAFERQTDLAGRQAATGDSILVIEELDTIVNGFKNSKL